MYNQPNNIIADTYSNKEWVIEFGKTLYETEVDKWNELCDIFYRYKIDLKNNYEVNWKLDKIKTFITKSINHSYHAVYDWPGGPNNFVI